MAQFESKTVTHPNPRISQEEALTSLYAHPTFPEGGRLASIKRVAGRWEAVIQFPKQAAPPAFGDDSDGDAPDGPPKPPSDDSDSPLEKALDGDEPKNDPTDEDKDKDGKPKSIEDAVASLTSLVTQIAEAVGVHPHGDAGEDAPLGPHADGPPGPPPPPGPPGGPPGGAAPRPKPPLRPGMAPPGATPVGAPSFAATKPHEIVGKVRSFIVSSETDESLEECKKQIEAVYGPSGYKVVQMAEGDANESGARKVRAKISHT